MAYEVTVPRDVLVEVERFLKNNLTQTNTNSIPLIAALAEALEEQPSKNAFAIRVK